MGAQHLRQQAELMVRLLDRGPAPDSSAARIYLVQAIYEVGAELVDALKDLRGAVVSVAVRLPLDMGED
jgi:hypothetical protein